LEIRHFKTFKTIVELKSFSQAAKQLSYGPSTVTEHIQILERTIGAPLFNRLGKKITVTHVGKDLYTHVLELFDIYDKIENVYSLSLDTKGIINVGVSESLLVFRLKTVLQDFREHYPNVNIKLVSDTCASLRDMLHTGELDLIVTLSPKQQHPDLITKHISEENLVFISGRESKIDEISMSTVSQLERECFLFTEGSCSLRQFFQNYLYSKGITPQSSLSFSSMEALKHCVISNLGISLVPQMSVQHFIDNEDVKVIKCEDDPLMFTTQYSYHKDKWLSPIHEYFIERVADAL
jgi:DNA-binding transcriptional LysR family regulator